MLGKPKYNYKDTVTFFYYGKILTGSIAIIDANGTFEDDSDVSYDIMVEEEKYITPINPKGECLYKHISEKYIQNGIK